MVRREGFEPPAFRFVGCLTHKSESFRLRFVLFTTVRSANLPLFPSSPARFFRILGQNWVRNRGIPIFLAWRQIFQCSMRPFGIIKLNIGSDAGLKCSIGSNISSVELFFFQWCEKRLCYRIVIWLTGARKRLLYFISCKSCWNRWDVYCAPQSLWKTRPVGGFRSS